MNTILLIQPDTSISFLTLAHTHLFIWRQCIWISPRASFSSSSIWAGNLSHEPVSSEAGEHLSLRTQRQDNTLKASPSYCPRLNPDYLKSLSLSPLLYCRSLTATWQLRKIPQIGPETEWCWLSVYTCSSPQRLPAQVGKKMFRLFNFTFTIKLFSSFSHHLCEL